MALPVYQRRGIMYADLPRVETANLKEGAAAFDNINRKLDQLQSFIVSKGTEQAKEQAMQYAAQNPVTEEQIAEATASKGEQKSWLSALTGGNVYDETLAAAQGSMLSNQLSIEATKKFRELQVKAENNQLGFDDAQLEIQDIIDGYAATISAFSPEASIKARATMATAGNNVLKSVAEKQSKIMAAAQAAKVDDDLFELKRSAEDMFFMGDSFNPTTQTYVRAEDRAKAIMQPLLDQAVGMGVEGKVPGIYNAFREARINGVARGILDDRFAASPTKAIRKVINGDLGEYESSWAVMSDKERDDVLTKVRKEVAERNKLDTQADKDRTDELHKKAIELQYEAETADRTRQREIAGELWGINSELGTMFTPRTHLEKIADGKLDEQIDNDELVFELQGAVDDGVLDDNAIKYLAQNDQITWKQAGALQNRIVQAENREIRSAVRSATAQIEELPLKPAEKKRRLAAVKTEIYKADPTVDLQTLVDARVQQEVNSIQVQRANSVKLRIAKALKKVFSNLEDDELEAKAQSLMDNPSLVGTIKMDASVKYSIEKALKSLER